MQVPSSRLATLRCHFSPVVASKASSSDGALYTFVAGYGKLAKRRIGPTGQSLGMLAAASHCMTSEPPVPPVPPVPLLPPEPLVPPLLPPDPPAPPVPPDV